MSIDVIMDNYGDACHPGQTIAGRLECNFNKEKNLRAIRIKFKGRAETEWYESESYYDHSTKKHKTRRVRYSAEEVYFDAEYVLVQGGDNFTLPPGRHSYPFSYILPAQLPSSFEGSYGNIRYSVKGIVDRPWKFDYEAKIGLNVLSPLDLNYVPGLRESVSTSVDKTMCCFWCKSGPLTFDISLPSTGFCPGQDVSVGAYVQNMSNVSSENVKFKIYKNLEFISHYPSTHHRYDETLVAECTDVGIGAHGEHSWTSILKIPLNMMFPNLIPCSIVNVSYRLKAKVVLPFPHSNLSTEVPIMIGSIPLAGVQPVSLGPPPSTEYPLPAYNQMPGSQVTPYPPGPIGDASAPSDSAPLIPYPPNSKYGPTHEPPYPSEKLGADGLPYATNNSSAAQYPGGPPPVGAAYPGSPPFGAAYPGPPYPGAPPPAGAPYPGAPPPTGAPYPGAPPPPAGAPYSGASPSVNAPYPGAPPASGAPPYPGASSYPPSSTENAYSSPAAPYPSEKTGYPPGNSPYPPAAPYPSGPSAPYSSTPPAKATAPPSYDESQKSEKQ